MGSNPTLSTKGTPEEVRWCDTASGRSRSTVVSSRWSFRYVPMLRSSALGADPIGNLAYAPTARNFNPLMAADIVVAESKEIVPVGVTPPD
ncbi:MAG TPA: hypothetical protein VH041_10400 [Caldimonas sp.]|nr:hypothetical protein [Caldimonas sp.]HEX4234708.1 hypothetical protein [Caldimonas sp.]